MLYNGQRMYEVVPTVTIVFYQQSSDLGEEVQPNEPAIPC